VRPLRVNNGSLDAGAVAGIDADLPNFLVGRRHVLGEVE